MSRLRPEDVAPRFVDVAREGDVLTVTFNRPEKRNALPDDVHRVLPTFFSVIGDDPCRVVVFTGAGPAFCSGGDIEGSVLRDEAARLRVLREAVRIVTRLLEMPQVTVARVNGPAVGLGLSIALGCDFLYARTDAWFSDTHVDLGLVPGDGAGSILPELIGLTRARELLMRCTPIDGIEAERIGLVTRALEPDRLDDGVDELVRDLLAKPPHALTATKRMLNTALRSKLELLLTLAIAEEGVTMGTDDNARIMRGWRPSGSPVGPDGS